jgi:hypothetical protein
MTARHFWGWVVLGAGVLMLLVGAGLLFQRSHSNEVAALRLPCADIVAGCDWPEQHLAVKFDQTPQAMKPFQVLVSAKGAQQLYVSFAMKDMQMGMNRYRLLPVGPERWQAQVTLPVCVHGRSDWEMALEIDGRQWLLPFTAH